MGNITAKFTKRAMRPFKNFAVEARTERVLAKEKPISAPWHPTTQKRIDEIMKNNPHLMEEQSKNKDETLNSRLKEVYVTSHDKPEIPISTEKPLPSHRKSVEQAEFGYQEPVRVTRGKLSIRQALVLIGRHQQDPAKYDALALAKEFTIHPIVSGNILKHFKTFEYYKPPKVKTAIEVKDYIDLKSLPVAKETVQPQIEDHKIKS
ncbi:hypothetical protein DAPPUDRAFT_227633 [Daphnia pulex]|uniref:NDUFAF4-like protein n=1 Tax=Daphnia pulex TaxID=6669 RepID=E9H7W1_DAPPU|nr:hypothetical protein DAPPUDRAFT_227633 [Daphnia pulex]|eukprot:EFX72177.1 hypothetical protein DAPPUDRAFT_227633 [Daphnia pulex]